MEIIDGCYDSHLHLEVFRTSKDNFEKSFILKNNDIITINARNNPIVNPFNFEENYTNGGNY